MLTQAIASARSSGAEDALLAEVDAEIGAFRKARLACCATPDADRRVLIAAAPVVTTPGAQRPGLAVLKKRKTTTSR